MRSNQPIRLVHVLSILMFSAAMACAQIIPNQGTPLESVTTDTRKDPGTSGSYMEIFVNGEWTTDISTNFDPEKPTLVLVHGWRRGNLDAEGNILSMSIDKYWADATSALSARVNQPGVPGDINILGWNWVIPASTRELDPLARYSVVVPLCTVHNQGLLLAQALRQLAPVGKVHLLGHSLGAKLVGVAGCFAPDIPLDQVTLMDGPEIDTGNTPLVALVDTDPVHLEANMRTLVQRNVYIDSYASAFGGSYPGEGIPCTQLYMTEDATLFQFIQLALDAHGFPIAWYFGGNAGLVGKPGGTIDPTTGDVCQNVGAAWSAVLNRIDPIESIVEQRRIQTEGPDPNNPIAGLDHELVDRKSQPYSLVNVAHVNAPKSITTQNLDFTNDGTVQWFRQGNVSFTQAPDAKAVLTTGSAVYLFTSVTVPLDDTTLEFDFRLTNPLPSDRFTVFADDKLLLQLEGAAFPPDQTGAINLGPLDFADAAGKTITLTFCYTSNEPGHIAEISNVRLHSHQKPLKYALVGSPRYGQGLVFPKNRMFQAGTEVTLTAIPDPGFFIQSWAGTQQDRSSQPTNTVIMDSNKTVTVQFASESSPCSGLGIPLIALLLLSFNSLLTPLLSKVH